MALSRIGSECLIEVTNQQLKLSIHGNTERIAGIAGIHNLNSTASLSVFPLSPFLQVKTIDSSNNLNINAGTSMLPVFFEESQYLVTVERKRTFQFTVRQNGIDITSDFFQQGEFYIGNLSFQSEVGYTPLEVMGDGKLLLRLTLEVFPSKIDYQRDYASMMEDLNREIASIVFQMYSKTYLFGKAQNTAKQTAVEFLSILELIFDRLSSSIDYVAHNFRHNIESNHQITGIHKVKRASRETTKYLLSNPNTMIPGEHGHLFINGKRYTPQKIVENRKSTTHDIFENRYVKYIITDTIRSISRLERLLQDRYRSAVGRYKLVEKRRVLGNYLSRYFRDITDLQGNRSMSLVFQMAPGYQEVYKNYLLLKKGLDLGEDLYAISPKEVHELYEYWCYLKVHNLLKEIGYAPISDGIVKPRNNGLYLSMSRDKEASVSYHNGENTLTLWYNKSYNGLPTNDQRPDIVLHMQNKNQSQSRMYIFDAKYRSVNEAGKICPQVDDINIMHRYRDAIVSRTGKALRYKYEAFGAFVLFPCADEASFLDNKFYRSISEVNIGAFPMLPGSTELLKKHLTNLIGQTSIEANTDRPIQDEYDDYARFKLENVMVVNVKDSEHLQAYLTYHFFHLPQRFLSNMRFGVEYLAFYQSRKSFGDNEAGIQYYARIKGYSTYRRGDCMELPIGSSNPDALYHRFDLDEIQQIGLIKPIQYGTQIFSFTTTYLLLNAENMHELKLGSNFEVKVYKTLRRFADEHALRLVKKSKNIYLVGTQTVELLDGNNIRLDGAIITFRDLNNHLRQAK